MSPSVAASAPTIIWVDCPAGAKRGADLYCFRASFGVDDRRLHARHRAFDPAIVLFGREAGQAGDGRQLDVDRHAVGIQPGLMDQFGIGVGNGLEVDIAAEIVILAQADRATSTICSIV